MLRFMIASSNAILSGVAIAYASLMRQAQRARVQSTKDDKAPAHMCKTHTHTWKVNHCDEFYQWARRKDSDRTQTLRFVFARTCIPFALES